MTTAVQPETADRISILFQYTVEAYKMFQKLSELLPNPMAAHVYENLAEDERNLRDLIEIKYSDPGVPRTKIKLEQDLSFQKALEGDLSHVEMTETMIVREKSMADRLTEFAKTGPEAGRNLFLYFAAAKRAHIMYIERELQMLRLYPDWYEREDAESLVVHGNV